MKRIAVSNVKNQDTSLDIVLTLGAMNVMNIVISSLTATWNIYFQNSSDKSQDTQRSSCQIKFEAPP